jgi:drug/metabolite transporter (DMT)-like permease
MQKKISQYWPAALFCVVIWGSSWTAFAIGIKCVSPLLYGGLANMIAAVILFTTSRAQKISVPKTSSSRWYIILLGFVYGAVPAACTFWGLQYTSSGMASVLVWTSPLFLVGLAVFLLRKYERVTVLKVIGVIVGFCGILAIFKEDLQFGFESRSVMGMVVLLLAAVGIALGVVMIKRAEGKFHAIMIALARATVGGTLLLMSAFALGDYKIEICWQAIAAILFSAVFVYSGADLVYIWLLQRLEVVKLSMLGLLAPVIAISIGFLLFHETPTTLDFIGTALVLVGLVTVNLG